MGAEGSPAWRGSYRYSDFREGFIKAWGGGAQSSRLRSGPVWRAGGSYGKAQHRELGDGDGPLALEATPGPGLGQPLSCCPHQRYLDEAEREKQQYMKELRAYQQSEAYKMCTEKIQEKKIKKGGKGWPPGS